MYKFKRSRAPSNGGKLVSIDRNIERYGTAAIVLHWLSAGAVLVGLLLGFATVFTSFAWNYSGPAVQIFRTHVTFGILIVALTVVRLVWCFFDNRPDALPNQPRWQSLAARATHGMLYALLISIPISGISVAIVSGAIPVLFMESAGPLPHFFKFWPSKVHSLAAFTLIGLVLLHVGAALYHQFSKRDSLLARMEIPRGPAD